MKKLLFIILAAPIVTSCTIKSSQYNLIKSFIIKENESSRPEKNWAVEWGGQNFDIYAINVGDQIIFADNDIQIFYTEQQVYKVIGLFPGEKTIEIKKLENNVTYYEDNRLISKDICKEEASLVNSKELISYSWKCEESESLDIHHNNIEMNLEGLLIGLTFKVHPDYPLLKLRLK